ncbi:hypothetical protein [Runella aurantiaca]|uniref:TonB-dependent receptor n=1 Tax=Runella aurantiaca TaxID=2282308 RepID=A0A369IBQ2_9BACT|nr:hypothetical protein [Runella aurantiaca]RDB05877.1 hypothetical protein DVG78_10710 [Runella aurantiaca]
MKHWWVLGLLVLNSAFGQVVITGKITQANQIPLASTNITLHVPRSSAILAFAIADKSGFYSIPVKSMADTLVLKVYRLGYATQQRTVLNKTQEVNFELSEQEIKLKEVVVKEKPITRSGDTLSYSVNAFKTQSDRAIGDVIRRLPGVEVQPDGKILYQGKAINKYYIEGLDLLDGRYNLANENLPADAVSRVEILENHQPVRMLDSLVFSENAALNIRLKNKITTTGTARVGVGASPFLWEANVTPMLFTRGQQLIASYQTNNIGQNIGRQIKTLTIEDVLNPFEKEPAKIVWARVMPLAAPTFSDTRWLDNKAHLGTINFLKKLPKGYEFRVNLSYLNDHQLQIGRTQTINYTPTDTINILEEKRNGFAFRTLEGSFALQKNDRGQYFKNQFSFKRQWDSETGLLLLNGNPLTQRVSSPFYALSNHLKDIFKIKKQVLTLQSFMSLQNAPQSLSVTPGPFLGLINNNLPYNRLSQEVTLRSFFTHNMVSLTKGLARGFSVSPQVGFQVENQRLQSQIARGDGEEVLELVGGTFENQLDWGKIHAYAKLQTQYRRNKWRITLNSPLNFYDFSIRDTPLQQQQRRQQFTFEPRLNTSYEATPFWTLSTTIDRQNTFGEIDNVFYGYLLRTYRNIERRNAPLPANVSHGGRLNASYRNPVASIFGHASYSKRLIDNNLLYRTQLNANGAAESYALESSNRAINDVFMAQVSKYFTELSTQFTLEGQFVQTERPQIINGVAATVRNQNTTYGFRLDGKVAKWADWEYRYKKMDFLNQVNKRTYPPTSQQQHQFNLSLYPARNLHVGFKNEYYVNRLVAKSNHTLFSDLIIRFTWQKRKIDFETAWNNIWNTSQLSLVSTSAFSYLESSYQLRPMQMLQRVRFSF